MPTYSESFDDLDQFSDDQLADLHRRVRQEQTKRIHCHSSDDALDARLSQLEQQRWELEEEKVEICRLKKDRQRFEVIAKVLATTREFKIVLVGEGGVGKTTFIQKLVTGKFERNYVATGWPGVEVRHVLHTNYGPVQFAIQDTNGRYVCNNREYYQGAHGAIVMFDITSRLTYKKIPVWHRDVECIVPGIPTVVVGNKVEIADRKVKPKQMTYPRKHGLQYFDVSVKKNVQLEMPLLHLARQLTGIDDLEEADPISFIFSLVNDARGRRP